MAIVKRRGKGGFRYGVKVYRAGGVQEWHGTYTTLREAKDVERRELSKPRLLLSETCDGFAERWTRDYPRPRRSTNKKNDSEVRPFGRAFAGVRLGDVDRPAARKWALGNPSKLAAVRAMFTDAVTDGYCAQNPFANLRLPQSRGRKDLDPLSESEFERLAETALSTHGDYGAEFRALILFAAHTLMRPSEITVLEWSDIDFDAGEVRVTKTLSGDKWVELPKNGQTRTVVLPPPAREALRTVPRRTDTDRIFSTKRGRRFSKSNFHYAWNPVRCAFGMPKMDFYELKHYGCTYWLDVLGLSAADVALQCGHTDGGRLIQERYGHPSKDLARERMKRAWGERVTPLQPVGGGEPFASTPSDSDEPSASVVSSAG